MGPREVIVAILCLPFMSVSPTKNPYEELLICVTYKYNIMGMLYVDVSQILLRYIKMINFLCVSFLQTGVGFVLGFANSFIISRITRRLQIDIFRIEA